jgi:hypothetical protein
MKCQSDYDVETDTLLRQADHCMEEWWEGEPPKSVEPSGMTREENKPTLIAIRELRKRGLLAVDEQAR